MSELTSNKTSYASDTHQLLTFTLGQEEYGVDILKIQEIKGLSAITPLPKDLRQNKYSNLAWDLL